MVELGTIGRGAGNWGLLAMAGLALGASPAAAQEEADQPLPPPAIEEREGPAGAFGLGSTDYTLRLRTSWEPHTEFQNQDATVKVWRSGAEFTAAAPLSESWRVRLRADSEYSNWNFDGTTGLAPGTAVPFEEISTHGISLGVENLVNDRWSWTAQGRIEVGLEGEAKGIDGVSGLVGAGVLYQVQPGLKVGGGALVIFPVEEYTRVLPLPLLDAQLELSERWMLTASLPQSAGVRYTPDRDFFVELGVRVRYKRYRLSADNPTPEGVFREFAVPLTLEVNWRFDPAWTLQAGFGVNLYQQLTMDDKDGFELAQEKTDPSAIFSLGLKWDF